MSMDERRSTDEKLKTDEKRRDGFRGLHSEITEKVLGVFFDVYNELGGGFLESVYHEALKIALTQARFRVVDEVPVPVRFRGDLSRGFDCERLCSFGVEGSFVVRSGT
jgi:GxxExxY protein